MTHWLSRCLKDALFEPKSAPVSSLCLCFLIFQLVITGFPWRASDLRTSTSWWSSWTTWWGLPCFLFLSLLPSRWPANPICSTFKVRLAYTNIFSHLGTGINFLNGLQHSSPGPAPKTQVRSQYLPLQSLQWLLIWPEIKATRLCGEHDWKCWLLVPSACYIFFFIYFFPPIDFMSLFCLLPLKKGGWEVHDFLSILFTNESTVSRTVPDTLKNVNKLLVKCWLKECVWST